MPVVFREVALTVPHDIPAQLWITTGIVLSAGAWLMVAMSRNGPVPEYASRLFRVR